MPQPQAAIYGSAGVAYPFYDRITGIAGSTLQLSYVPLVNPSDALPAPLIVVKNGVVLDPGGGSPAYTLNGSQLTLAVAAVGTDVFLVYYWYPSSGVLS